MSFCLSMLRTQSPTKVRGRESLENAQSGYGQAVGSCGCLNTENQTTSQELRRDCARRTAAGSTISTKNIKRTTENSRSRRLELTLATASSSRLDRSMLATTVPCCSKNDSDGPIRPPKLSDLRWRSGVLKTRKSPGRVNGCSE